MADPASRRSSTLNRLRSQLRRKRESLADQFDFKIYMAVVFKDKDIETSVNALISSLSQDYTHPDNQASSTYEITNILTWASLLETVQKKKSALFEVTEVIAVMTSDYKDSILKGVQEEVYSLESSQQLLEKDVVQLHAPRYRSLRKDLIGHVQEIDFFLWPRNDIDRVTCLLFSRWKGDENSEYRLIQAKFEIDHLDYEKQLRMLISRKEHAGLIINDASQSLFLFVDKHHIQTEKSKVALFKISNICLHLPQDQLTNWGIEQREDVLSSFMPD